MPYLDFTEFLRNLQAEGNPVSMDDVAGFCAGTVDLPERPFAVTFDDGFASNYTLAAPTLESLEIPATFYITSGFVENQSGSWIDQIEQAVEQTPVVLGLRLPFPPPRNAYRTWDEKTLLLGTIRHHVKQDPSINPYALADSVTSQLGATLVPDPELDGRLTWEQVSELSRHDLFTIGGHGLTHRILEHLDLWEVEQEIRKGLILLRTHVHGPVTHFSYPEGQPGCDDPAVTRVLERYGITCAVTAQPTKNLPGTSPFGIGRHLVA